MKSTLAFAAIAIAQVSASFCPFPASMNNSPCNAASACVSEGLLHADCQADIESFCCAGTSFGNYPEIATVCDTLASCESAEVTFRSARSSRVLGASGSAENPPATGDSCSKDCDRVSAYTGEEHACVNEVCEVVKEVVERFVVPGAIELSLDVIPTGDNIDAVEEIVVTALATTLDVDEDLIFITSLVEADSSARRVLAALAVDYFIAFETEDAAVAVKAEVDTLAAADPAEFLAAINVAAAESTAEVTFTGVAVEAPEAVATQDVTIPVEAVPTCGSPIVLYGALFTEDAGVQAEVLDPFSEDAVVMTCSGTSPDLVWTAEVDELPFAFSSFFKLSLGGSLDNTFDCDSSEGCVVECENNMNKVTVTLNNGDENPTVSCVESETPLTVQYASDIDGDLATATAVDFNTLGLGEYDHLEEDMSSAMTVNYEIRFGLGADGRFKSDTVDYGEQGQAIDVVAGDSFLVTFDADNKAASYEIIGAGDSVTSAVALPFITTAAPAGAVVGFVTILATFAVSLLM